MDTLNLPDGTGRIRYQRALFSPAEASQFTKQLREELPWSQSPIRIAHQIVDQPRLTCYLCEDPDRLTYTYAYTKMAAFDWSQVPSLRRVRARVEQELGMKFNSVLCNLYRTGRDYMGYHCDDENELRVSKEDDRITIASVSFGAERRFLIRPKPKWMATLTPKLAAEVPKSCGGGGGGTREGIVEYSLASGSLLVMDGRTQTFYKHSLPKMMRVSDYRINLTFRNIYPVAERPSVESGTRGEGKKRKHKNSELGYSESTEEHNKLFKTDQRTKEAAGAQSSPCILS